MNNHRFVEPKEPEPDWEQEYQAYLDEQEAKHKRDERLLEDA